MSESRAFAADRQYQLFDPLRDEEYAALKADIAKRGVMVPIEVDEHGNILDGHHRVRVCQELGLSSPPSITRIGLDEAGKREHVLKLNLLRRHLGVIQWAEKFRILAELRGVELGKRGPKPEGSNSLTVSELAAEVGVPESTARRRIQVAEVLRAEPELKQAVDAGEKSPTEALREVRQKQKQERRAEQVEAIAAEPPSLPTGPYRVIVADPPWAYSNRADDPTHRAANPYPSMQIDAIKALAVDHLAHDDAVLWLWTTNAHLREAFDVVDAWGFTYKTTLTWAKDRMGTGDWLRGQTEHCLMAVRGRPVICLTNQTTLLRGPLRSHSEKPDEFYQLVEALCPGSKVELFARSEREGWVSFGDELSA